MGKKKAAEIRDENKRHPIIYYTVHNAQSVFAIIATPF